MAVWRARPPDPRKGNVAHPELCLGKEHFPDLTEVGRKMPLPARATGSLCRKPSLSDAQEPSMAPGCLSLESLLLSDTQGLQSLVLTWMATKLPSPSSVQQPRPSLHVPSQPHAVPSPHLPVPAPPRNHLPYSPSFQNVTS